MEELSGEDSYILAQEILELKNNGTSNRIVHTCHILMFFASLHFLTVAEPEYKSRWILWPFLCSYCTQLTDILFFKRKRCTKVPPSL